MLAAIIAIVVLLVGGITLGIAAYHRLTALERRLSLLPAAERRIYELEEAVGEFRRALSAPTTNSNPADVRVGK